MEGRTIAAIGLVGGAVYLVFARPDLLEGLTGRAVAPLGGFDPQAGALDPRTGERSTAQNVALYGGIGASIAAKILPGLLGGTGAAVAGGTATAAGSTVAAGGAAAAGTAGTAGGGGALIGGTAGTVTAIAIPAAAAILSWGIATEGWFRGGEEGIRVNPARDGWFNWFIAYSSYNLDGIGVFPKDAWGNDDFDAVRFVGNVQTVRYNAYLEVLRRYHVPEHEIDRTLTAVYAAESMTALAAAVDETGRVMRKFSTEGAA